MEGRVEISGEELVLRIPRHFVCYALLGLQV